jgi:hypothetical protein
MRRSPFQPFEQHRHLRWGQRNRALLRRWPGKAALLQPLGEQAEALAVPVQNLDEITSAAAEAEDGTRERILLQHILRHDAQAVEAAPRVGDAAGQIDAHSGRDRDHRVAPSSAATSRAKAAESMHSSTLMTRPLVSAISTKAGRRPREGAREP